MNPKELVEVAKAVKKVRLCILADYILSFVRSDDDEPVTQEWLASIGADVNTDKHRSYIRYKIPDEQLFMVLFVSNGEVYLNNRLIAFAETRGEFRALLRGLRVPLND